MSSFHLSLFVVLSAVNILNCANTNNPQEEPCDQQDSQEVCQFHDHFVEVPAWQLERSRKVTSLKMSNLQSENLPVNVGESFPNLLSYTATETSFRILKKENLRHLRVLEELTLQNGQLIRIRRDAFDDVPNLQKLNLGYNLIRIVSPENFREIQKLEFLSLKNNEIEEVNPRMFRNLLNLKELDMDDNKVSSITGETFASNRRIKRISMSRNNLKFVDATTFSGLKELQVLNLSGNDCIDKEYKAIKSVGGFLAAVRMDMSSFCQIGVKV